MRRTTQDQLTQRRLIFTSGKRETILSESELVEQILRLFSKLSPANIIYPLGTSYQRMQL
jgi:hypothetical protein